MQVCTSRTDTMTKVLYIVPDCQPSMVDTQANQIGRGGSVGWIVRDACVRLHVEIGCYQWDQWNRAARALGLDVVVVNSGPVAPACLLKGTIVVPGGLAPETTARMVWHEIGHHVLHAGTPDTWRSMHSGALLLAKWERQAEEFASEFPVWN